MVLNNLINRNQHCQVAAVAKKRLGGRSVVTMHLKMGQASTILPFFALSPFVPHRTAVRKECCKSRLLYNLDKDKNSYSQKHVMVQNIFVYFIFSFPRVPEI